MVLLKGKVAVRVSIVLILSALSSGCGLIMIGPAAEKIDVESGTNEQKNLDAIRAMQADQSGRSATVSSPHESRPCTTDGVGGQRCAER
ncbi:MAG: hypothetical protein P0111_17345 [Nitrospira sp.]|nr:hypothetical protein [Nitrospira sp.]